MARARSIRRLVLASAVVVALTTEAADIATAAEIDDLVAATSHSPAQYVTTFDESQLAGLGPIGTAPAITGDAALDARIRAIGEARGYRRRPEPNRELVPVDGVLLQPEAAYSWLTLRAAAREAGHTIWMTSGHRDAATQARILRRRLPGTPGSVSDAAIERVLRTVAAPGYSRHHTGYAIDIRSPEGSGHRFRDTAAYAWLSADDFANAKAHGWIPSYPEGSNSGPQPEPWELVWVGAVNIICGDLGSSAEFFCNSPRTGTGSEGVDRRVPRRPTGRLVLFL